MKTSRLLIGALVSFVALVLFTTSAHADTMSIDPTSGPVGTVITVSGDDCLPTEEFPDGPVVSVGYFHDGDMLVIHSAIPDDSGDWSDTFTVPDDLPVGAEIEIGVDCVDVSGSDPVLLFSYGSVFFTVTEVIVTTTTTEPEPTTTTTTEPEPTTTTTAQPTTTTTEEEPPPLPLMCPDGYEVQGDRCVAIAGNTFNPPPGGQVITDGGLAEDDYYSQNLWVLAAVFIIGFSAMLFLTRNKAAKKYANVDDSAE